MCHNSTPIRVISNDDWTRTQNLWGCENLKSKLSGIIIMDARRRRSARPASESAAESDSESQPPSQAIKLEAAR